MRKYVIGISNIGKAPPSFSSLSVSLLHTHTTHTPQKINTSVQAAAGRGAREGTAAAAGGQPLATPTSTNLTALRGGGRGRGAGVFPHCGGRSGRRGWGKQGVFEKEGQGGGAAGGCVGVEVWFCVSVGGGIFLWSLSRSPSSSSSSFIIYHTPTHTPLSLYTHTYPSHSFTLSLFPPSVDTQTHPYTGETLLHWAVRHWGEKEKGQQGQQGQIATFLVTHHGNTSIDR